MRRRLTLVVAAALAAGCSPPPGADLPPSEAVREAPAPVLTESARFDSALAQAAPDAERLGTMSGDLAARAEALRARASGLSAPVLPTGARTRLTGALP